MDTCDINQFRSPHDLDHQWELKKKFILAHRDKYSGDRLACLAQIFSNIQYMGCRYEDNIMELMGELSQNLAEKSSQWDNKDRFVSANDAVQTRVRDRLSGSGRNQPPGNHQTESDSQDHRGQKRPVDNHSPIPAKRSNYSTQSGKCNSDIQYVTESGPFGKVVLFESSVHSESPAGVIQRTAAAAQMEANFSFEPSEGSTTCKLLLDGLYLATGQGASKKEAKESACQVAIARLKETSFTILVLAKFSGSSEVDRNLNQSENHGIDRASEDEPMQSNIGRKIMQLMGWSGGGLGKDEQGIQEPIRASENDVKRRGLGIQNFSDFRRKVTKLIEDFTYSDSQEDLVFTSEFSKDERKAIHELARKYNLKSRSYGPDDDRQLVLSRKIKPLEIVEELLKCGGVTPKYRLIPPESMKERFQDYKLFTDN